MTRDPFADARLLYDEGRWRWLLDDGRLLTEAEMVVRERRIRAGLDPDEATPPDGAVSDSTLGAVILDARLERGLSQRDLAALAGVSQSMVARLERGSREPSWRTFRMLLHAIGLEPVVSVQTTAPSSESSSRGGP